MDLFDNMVERPDSQDSGAVIDNRESSDLKRILQPKTVTFAHYRLSKLHSQMLVHIKEELQLYISNKIDDISSNELISLPLFCEHYPHFKNDGAAFLKSVKSLMKDNNVIAFEWRYDPEKHGSLLQWMQKGNAMRSRSRINPTPGALIQKVSVIIVDAERCDNDPGKVIIKINPQILPFLLYYGPGVGGTYFDRDVSLRLNSSYSFRLYEMLMDWSSSSSSKTISITELRSILKLPESYRVNDIKRRVLDVAKEEIEQASSSVLFDYELKFDLQYGPATGSRGQLPANCVVFTVSKKEGFDFDELSRKQLLLFLTAIADREKSFLCGSLAKQIVDNHQDSFLKNKFFFYDKKVSKGEMRVEEYKNTMLKIVRETTGVDLRSDSHRRNSIRFMKKNFPEPLSSEPKLLFE